MGAKSDQANGPPKGAIGTLTGDNHIESAAPDDRRAGVAEANLGHAKEEDGGFLSEQPKRRTFESVFARVVATAGIVGIGTALGAILIAANVAGWITGLAVSTVAVALAAMLWRSRRL